MRRAATPLALDPLASNSKQTSERHDVALTVDMLVALVAAHIDEGFFAADGGIELVLLLGGASLAVVLTGAGRFSADAALDLPRYFWAAGTRTRGLTRHSPRREQAHPDAKVTT
jgi:hypothetical protein